MKNRFLSNAFRSKGPVERFWLYVRKTENCWYWLGRPGGPKGRDYGSIKIDGKTFRAHRFAYELLRGPIPEGLVIDHLCRNRFCVNPDHMEIVTSRENTLRGNTLAAKQIRQTHCIHGHELSGDNLAMAGRKRICRECRRTNCRLWREEKSHLRSRRTE